MMRLKVRRVALACVVGALVVAACGGDDDTDGTVPAADSAPAAETTASSPAATEASSVATDAVTVPATVDDTTAAPATDDPGVDVDGLTIVDFAFSAANVPATVEFTLTNDDEFAHTVSDRDGAFDVRVEGSSTAPLTIERAGTYEIFCRIHPSMSGTITAV